MRILWKGRWFQFTDMTDEKRFRQLTEYLKPGARERAAQYEAERETPEYWEGTRIPKHGNDD